jgi:hypothetical protein
MAKLLAFLLMAAVMVAVASAQYYAAYPRAAVVASPYAYRAAYAPAVGYAGTYGAYPAGRVVYG